MKPLAYVFGGLFALAVAACGGEGGGAATRTSASATARLAPGRPSARASAQPSPSVGPNIVAGSYKDQDLPVAPDFEDDAEREITPDNFEQKLAEIEQELGLPASVGSGHPSPLKK